ncbi:MAG: hypothetical protein SGILL_005426 [Bacillariaceae sp.]
MKLVGHCADRYGYLKPGGDIPLEWDVDPSNHRRSSHRHPLLRASRDGEQERACWSPVHLSPSDRFRYRYKDLQEEDEMASKICGKKFFSNVLVCKQSKDLGEEASPFSHHPSQFDDAVKAGKHSPTSGSSTKLCSGSSSSFEKGEEPKICDKNISVPSQMRDKSASNRGGRASNLDNLFYQWNMETGYNGDANDRQVDPPKGGSPKQCLNSPETASEKKNNNDNMLMNGHVSSSDMNNVYIINCEGLMEGGDLGTDDWIYSSDEEGDDDDRHDQENRVISLLQQECNNYRDEALALREEINNIKSELGSLRQQMSGLAFHSDSVWV